MKRKNGFTLIEVLAVIIILGIVMTIAIPAVSKYILRSDDSTYANDVIAYLETARAEYEMKGYGSLLKEDEIMIVPLEYIKLEKGSFESPNGDFELSQSYIIVSPYKNGYQFYANVVDDIGKGVSMKTQQELNNESIEDNLSDVIEPYETYYDSTKELVLNKNTYKMCEVRDLETPDETYDDAIIILCSEGEFTNLDEANQIVKLQAVNRSGKEIKNGSYTNSGLDFTFSKEDEDSADSEIYYCQDTTNTCMPNIKVANGDTITNYNTITSDYYIRYKLVGSKGLGKEFSYKAKFDLEGPVCTFKEIPIIYYGNEAIAEMECIDSLSKIAGMSETNSLMPFILESNEEMKNSFALSNNNISIETVSRTATKDGVKYLITLKGQGHGVANIEFKENQMFDNAENGNNNVNKDITAYGVFKVTLNNQGATTPGTTEIYELYSEGWFSNSEVSSPISKMTIPTKTGYTFGGYYTETNGNGTQIIDAGGNIISGKTMQFRADGVLHAKWTANELIFSGKNITKTFSTSQQTETFTAATNGTGGYTYTEKSETNSSGTSTNYISVSGTTITIAANTPAGTYTYVITAKDNNSGVTKDATFTITINKINCDIAISAFGKDGIVSGDEINLNNFNSTNLWIASDFCPNFSVSVSNTSVLNSGTLTTGTSAPSYIAYANYSKYAVVNVVGSGSSNVTVTAANDNNYNPQSVTFKVTVTVVRDATTGSCNSLTYTGSNQVLASGGANVTYSNNSQKDAGSYTVTVNANSGHAFSNGTTSTTLSCSIAKAASSITCKNGKYTSGAVQTYSSSSGCSSITNGSVEKGGVYTVTCVGDSNHNNSSCTSYILPYYKWIGTNTSNCAYNCGVNCMVNAPGSAMNQHKCTDSKTEYPITSTPDGINCWCYMKE